MDSSSNVNQRPTLYDAGEETGEATARGRLAKNRLKKERSKRGKASVWVPGTLRLFHELLLKGLTVSAIAKQMGLSVASVYGFLSVTKNPVIKAAWSRNKKMRAQTEAEEKGPSRAETFHDRIIATFGMTPQEYSGNNMRIFYADEIKEYNRTGKIDPTVRRTLFEYDLVEKPAWWPATKDGRGR